MSVRKTAQRGRDPTLSVSLPFSNGHFNLIHQNRSYTTYSVNDIPISGRFSGSHSRYTLCRAILRERDVGYYYKRG